MCLSDSWHEHTRHRQHHRSLLPIAYTKLLEVLSFAQLSFSTSQLKLLPVFSIAQLSFSIAYSKLLSVFSLAQLSFSTSQLKLLAA